MAGNRDKVAPPRMNKIKTEYEAISMDREPIKIVISGKRNSYIYHRLKSWYANI